MSYRQEPMSDKTRRIYFVWNYTTDVTEEGIFGIYLTGMIKFWARKVCENKNKEGNKKRSIPSFHPLNIFSFVFHKSVCPYPFSFSITRIP